MHGNHCIQNLHDTSSDSVVGEETIGQLAIRVSVRDSMSTDSPYLDIEDFQGGDSLPIAKVITISDYLHFCPVCIVPRSRPPTPYGVDNVLCVVRYLKQYIIYHNIKGIADYTL